MRILITGGAGFIGSHIADRYLALGHEVTVVDDLSSGKWSNLDARVNRVEMGIENPALEEIFREGRFDVVNHQAANVSVAISVRDPGLDARINIMGSLNVLAQCAQYGVTKVIFASSGGVCYGDAAEWPAHEGLPFGPISPYGITKVAMEWYLRFYQREYGLKFTALRYSNVYGPRQDPHGEAGVVAIFTKLLLQDKQCTINGDGLHVRDYVYVKDVAEASVLALASGDNDSFNVGTGVETTNERLYRTIANAVGSPREPHFGPERPGDLRKNVLSSEKIRRVMGWAVRYPLAEGLGETVEWFRNQ